MKKVFSVLLAVAMVLALTSIAFAANTQIGALDKQAFFTIEDKIMKREGANDYVDMTAEYVPYGETLYLKLVTADGSQITSSDAVSSLKLSSKWTQNGKYISGIEIARKDGGYWIVIKTTGSSLSEADAEGTITISGKAYPASGTDRKTKIDKLEIPIIISFKFEEVSDDTEIVEEPKIFRFDKDAMQDEELELTCEDSDVTFTVDTTHQSKMVLSYNQDGNDKIEKAYPDANLDFHNFNNAVFRKTGTLLIPADGDSYLYEVVDGGIRAVNAKYDEFEEAFLVKTKTLGSYVVSDIELKIAAAVAPVAAEGNPPTGAAL